MNEPEPATGAESGPGRAGGVGATREGHRALLALMVILCLVTSRGARAIDRWTTGGHATQATAGRAVDPSRLDRIGDLVRAGIADGALVGAVVLVGVGDEVVYREAFGSRAVVPAREPMTLDTIFDLASLTKVVATTTSVMILVEAGVIRLTDRVATYVDGFERYGKQAITIADLLTHMSGLRPDLDLTDSWRGHATAIRRAVEEVPLAPPGTRFVYSDINFFLLGEIVGRVSGQPLDRFASERIFEPLGMRDTAFRPASAVVSRIAPTEPCTPFGWPCGGPGATMLRGVVHDPTARRMGGVAGHAGLFSTGDDLAIFARMLLGAGQHDGARVLAPLTIARMTALSTPPQERNRRALGWDLDSRFSANRGELFGPGSYGHTGFTGTSIWIDPSTRAWVIFLSSRLHPDGTGDVTPLRARVATAAAAALTSVPGVATERLSRWSAAARPSGVGVAGAAEPVLTGIDVLRESDFQMLAGKRVGLLTNHTGRARDGASSIDLLAQSEAVELVVLFSPEHGIRGTEDGAVASSRDARTNLQVHSLYGATRRPSSVMLEGLDTVVVDLQDVGSRFYTYATTMAYMLEAAASLGLEVVVLDRPNPINGFRIEGPTLDDDALGFTGYFPMPIRHGLTLGELARLFNAERALGAALTVVPMRGWSREAWFDATGQPWIDPSPNMRSLTQATLYPGIGAIEGTNISVGRGTDAPFERLGAPWIDGVELAARLNARRLPGLRFYPVAFTPTASKYAGERCEGVALIVTDRETLAPVRVGLEVAAMLHRLHPDRYDLDAAARLLGSAAALQQVRSGEDPALIARSWRVDEDRWRLTRAPYLLYP